MKYVDYREKLGLGFSNNEKSNMLRNIIINYLKLANERDPFNGLFADDVCFRFFQTVGEYPYYGGDYGDDRNIIISIGNETSTVGIISKFIVLINLLKGSARKEQFELLKGFLDELNIQYEIITDEDGYFIFPKGAKELDNALVSAPLEWLSSYPNSRKEWISALKDYANLTDDNASDVADKFRKALERFFQEFFGKTKSLENLKSEYGAYLKARGVPSEISNNFETLQKSYTDFMNNYAKHHNKTTRNVLEYIMYQTGNIIRLLITLKQEDKHNAD